MQSLDEKDKVHGSSQPIVHKISDYQSPTFKVHTTHLSFTLHDTLTKVTAMYLVEFLDRSNITDLILDGDSSIKNVEITINHTKIVPHITTDPNSSKSFIILQYEVLKKIIGLNPYALFTIVVKNEIDPSINTELQGMYMSNNIICTQCESHGFRRIVYSFDRPDILSRYIVTIQFDPTKYPVVLSNGDIVETIDENINNTLTRTVVYNDPHPKPSYLFALVAGDLGHIEDKHYIKTKTDERTIMVRIYGDKTKLDHLQYALKSVLLAMKWDEEKYGLFYDLSIFNVVCLDDFNMGAMENKGLNVFNSMYIRATPETATDANYKNILSVVGHEYFHNWTGNRVTLCRWFELTLKEGLTVFRDQNFSLDHDPSRDSLIIDRANNLRSSQFVVDDGPTAHPIRPSSYIVMDNFYTSTVYEKGAEIVRLYETLLGIDGFRRGMDLYFNRHDGQAVRCEDFWQAMYDANTVNKNIQNYNQIYGKFNQSMKSLFNWYHQPGTPTIKIEYNYDQIKSQFIIKCHQFNQKAIDINGLYQPVLIPIRIGLIDRQTKLTIHTSVLACYQESQTFYIDSIKSDCVPSLMRDFSAPVNVEYDMKDQDMLFLIRNDSNNFVRWDRIQKIHSDTMAKLYTDSQYNLEEYLKLLESILIDDTLNPYIKSRLIALPSLDEMSMVIKYCDPLKLHISVSTVINRKLAERCKQYVIDKSTMLINTINNAKYDPIDNDQLMNRTLFRLIINLLLYIDKSHNILDNLANVFDKTDNLTVKNACIGILAVHYEDSDDSNNISKYFITMLSKYYGKQSDNSLMASHWLRRLSSIHSPFVISAIMSIFNGAGDHTSVVKFNKTTPNHLYALINTFCHNPYAHYIKTNENGVSVLSAPGYEAIGSIMMEIDSYNSSVSSRIGRFFLCLDKLPEPNKMLMQNVIDVIKKSNKASEALKEILHI
jgi:aminopeptidase N